MHEQRKSKYNSRKVNGREQQTQSMIYDSGPKISSPGTSKAKKGKNVNNMLARLTKQTLSSGKKRNVNTSTEIYNKPESAYQSFDYKPKSAAKTSLRKHT